MLQERVSQGEGGVGGGLTSRNEPVVVVGDEMKTLCTESRLVVVALEDSLREHCISLQSMERDDRWLTFSSLWIAASPSWTLASESAVRAHLGQTSVSGEMGLHNGKRDWSNSPHWDGWWSD